MRNRLTSHRITRLSIRCRDLSRLSIFSFFIAIDAYAFLDCFCEAGIFLALPSLDCRSCESIAPGLDEFSFESFLFDARRLDFILGCLAFRALLLGRGGRVWRVILFQLVFDGFLRSTDDVIEGISFLSLAAGKQPVLLLVTRFSSFAIISLDHVYYNNKRTKPRVKYRYLSPSKKRH